MRASRAPGTSGTIVADREQLLGALDADHFVADANVERVTLVQRVGGLQHETLAGRDSTAHPVGHAAAGERDVRTTLEEDDLGLLVEPTESRRCRGATGDAAHDENSLGCHGVRFVGANGRARGFVTNVSG